MAMPFKPIRNARGDSWDGVAWTPFKRVDVLNDDPLTTAAHADPQAVFVNSRYQVAIWHGHAEPFGVYRHLSIKTHDRSARHDFRDLQRIKNELVGPECDAIEIYPAESKLVDGANQYHLWVFEAFKLPIGFPVRCVSDGDWRNSKQRPFAHGERPADCLDPEQFEALYQQQLAQVEGTS
jgi:hypothetical protein